MGPRSGVVLTIKDSCVDERASGRMDWILLPVTLIVRSWDRIHHHPPWHPLTRLPRDGELGGGFGNSGFSLSLSQHLSHVLSGVPPDRNFFGFLMSLALHANHMLVVSPRVLFRGPKANVDLNFMFIFVMTCSLYYPSEYISDHSQLNSNPIMGTWSSNVDGDVDIWKAMVKVQPRPRSCHLSMTCIRPMWLMTRKSVKKSFGLSTRGLGLRFLDNGQPNHLVVNHHDFVFYVFSCDELPCLSLNGWLPWCFFVLLESKCLLVFLCPWPPMRFH